MKELIEQYDSELPKYQHLNEKILNLVNSLLKDHPEIRIHDISFRVKERDSFIAKLQKKRKYEKLEDVTDISGIRIICYFEEDVDNVTNIIEAEFDIDPKNSVDKRKLKANEFGYKSQHLVVKFKSLRTELPEYTSCKDLFTEIQIRTILQHGWAEIEHDLGYKSSIAIPKNYVRDFNRVAALLETADKEFSHLKNKIANYESEIPERFKGDQNEIGIDKYSIKYFLENSTIIRLVEKEMAKVWDVPYTEKSSEPIEKILYVVNYLGVKTIAELNTLLIKKKEDLIENQKRSKQSSQVQTISGMSTGVSLFQLWMDEVEKRKNT